MGAGSSSFPYTLGSVNQDFNHPIFQFYSGTHNESGNAVSIFSYDKSRSNNNEEKLLIARNFIKRLKTLRHPWIVKYIDDVELDHVIYVVTEPLTPWNAAYRSKLNCKSGFSDDEIALGLYRVSSALSFLNSDCKLIHLNVHPVSIFIDYANNWKLGGLELCFEGAIDMPIFIKRNLDLIPSNYKSPEIRSDLVPSNFPNWCFDSWSFGCLVFECFNYNFSHRDQLSNLEKIPKELSTDYKKFISVNAKSRLSSSFFLESSYFSSQLFVQSILFLENLSLKSDHEKDIFFNNLLNMIPNLSKNCATLHLLPHICNSIEFGGGNRPTTADLSNPFNTHPKALLCMLKIGSLLNVDEFTKNVSPTIVKLYAAQERTIRLHLLQNLPEYIELLPQNAINDQIITNVVLGFTDAAPLLREATIKSMLYFIPKLNEKNLSNVVLPALGKLQGDPEALIRTNTTVLLGKIAPLFNEATRAKFLPAAFLRVFKDTFPSARAAGINSLMATSELYSVDIIAKIVIPNVSVMTIDSTLEVRESSMKCLSLFTSKLSALIEKIVDPVIINTPEMHKSVSSTLPALDNSGPTMLGTLGSWAYSSITSTVFAESASAKINDIPKQTVLPNNNIQNLPKSISNSEKTSTLSVKTSQQKNEVNSKVTDEWGDDFFQDFSKTTAVDAPVVSLSTKIKKDTNNSKQSKSILNKDFDDLFTDIKPKEIIKEKVVKNNIPILLNNSEFDILSNSLPPQSIHKIENPKTVIKNISKPLVKNSASAVKKEEVDDWNSFLND